MEHWLTAHYMGLVCKHCRTDSEVVMFNRVEVLDSYGIPYHNRPSGAPGVAEVTTSALSETTQELTWECATCHGTNQELYRHV